MTSDGKLLRLARKERHAEWKAKNMATLEASGLDFHVANGGEAVLFRSPDGPDADFYPSTGRWRARCGGRIEWRTFRGGADAFLRWYRARGAKS